MEDMRETYHIPFANRVHPFEEIDETCARLNAMWHEFFEDPATRAAYRERGIEIADEAYTETRDYDAADGRTHILRQVLIDARSDGVMMRDQAREIHMDICDELLEEIWDLRDEIDVSQYPSVMETRDVLPPKFTLVLELVGMAEGLPDDD